MVGLDALPRGLQAEITPALRCSAPDRLAGRPQPGTWISDRELDGVCAAKWFITWDEDAKGNPIFGTFNLHCAETIVPIG